VRQLAGQTRLEEKRPRPQPQWSAKLPVYCRYGSESRPPLLCHMTFALDQCCLQVAACWGSSTVASKHTKPIWLI
jgi:hypothetical protein